MSAATVASPAKPVLGIVYDYAGWMLYVEARTLSEAAALVEKSEWADSEPNVTFHTPETFEDFSEGVAYNVEFLRGVSPVFEAWLAKSGITIDASMFGCDADTDAIKEALRDAFKGSREALQSDKQTERTDAIRKVLHATHGWSKQRLIDALRQDIEDTIAGMNEYELVCLVAEREALDLEA